MVGLVLCSYFLFCSFCFLPLHPSDPRLNLRDVDLITGNVDSILRSAIVVVVVDVVESAWPPGSPSSHLELVLPTSAITSQLIVSRSPSPSRTRSTVLRSLQVIPCRRKHVLGGEQEPAQDGNG